MLDGAPAKQSIVKLLKIHIARSLFLFAADNGYNNYRSADNSGNNNAVAHLLHLLAEFNLFVTVRSSALFLLIKERYFGEV